MWPQPERQRRPAPVMWPVVQGRVRLLLLLLLLEVAVPVPPAVVVQAVVVEPAALAPPPHPGVERTPVIVAATLTPDRTPSIVMCDSSVALSRNSSVQFAIRNRNISTIWCCTCAPINIDDIIVCQFDDDDIIICPRYLPLKKKKCSSSSSSSRQQAADIVYLQYILFNA